MTDRTATSDGQADNAGESRDRRFPRSVYRVGEEPDVRFTLANERTFLSWIRTSLALLAAGVALEALDVPVDPVLGRTASVAFLALGTLIPVQAWLHWLRAERAMRLGRPLPMPHLVGPVALGTLLGGGLVLVGVLIA